MQTGYIAFIRANAPFLGAGALLALLSAFGQTFFIAIFGGEIREAYGLSNGDWGLIYMIGTMASAVIMIYAGGLADIFRVRTLGIAVVACLGLACLALAVNTSAMLIVFVVFALRFFGQGMSMHMSQVAMSRWFVASRGRALAIAGIGYMVVEMCLPVLMVWLKSQVDWRTLWICFALFCFAMCPILYRLLRLERTPRAEAQSDSATGMGNRHWTRMEALRHPIFWLMVPGITFFAGLGTAYWFHQVHYAEIKGWSHLALVSIFPIGSATLMASSALYGWAIDRFGAARLLPYYLLPYVAAFLLHAYAPSLAWAGAALMLMGFAGGGNGTILNACWAEFYGTNHLGAIKAAATSAMVFGSAVGPGVSGLLIDAGIDLEVQFIGYAAGFAFASAMMGIAAKIYRQSATPA